MYEVAFISMYAIIFLFINRLIFAKFLTESLLDFLQKTLLVLKIHTPIIIQLLIFINITFVSISVEKKCFQFEEFTKGLIGQKARADEIIPIHGIM